jgi:molecular chaperone HtpG
MPGEQEKPKAEKVLELNPSHPVFETLKSAYATDKEKCAEIARVLNVQARLIAGLPIENATEYCETVCNLLSNK